jgi:hypothetical protein
MRMPQWRDRRPLKRWRYAGVYGETCMVCAGVVHVAGIPQTFWAVWDRDRRLLRERTRVGRTAIAVDGDRVRVNDRGIEIQLALEPVGDPVDVVSRHGRSYIWTRKVPIAATGRVAIDGRHLPVAAAGIVDESAGYHARHTAWDWAAGVGISSDGRRLAWNLVAGVHDAPTGSERTVWVDGVASEVGPAVFAADLGGVTYPEGGLRFAEESVRRRRDRLAIISSDYVQPFGTVTGEVLPGVRIGAGFGVMERHRATW